MNLGIKIGGAKIVVFQDCKSKSLNTTLDLTAYIDIKTSGLWLTGLIIYNYSLLEAKTMSKDTMQLQDVELKFTYSHPTGKEVIIKGNINDNGYWQQWGASKEELGENIELIEEITTIINQYLIEK